MSESCHQENEYLDDPINVCQILSQWFKLCIGNYGFASSVRGNLIQFDLNIWLQLVNRLIIFFPIERCL